MEPLRRGVEAAQLDLRRERRELVAIERCLIVGADPPPPARPLSAVPPSH